MERGDEDASGGSGCSSAGGTWRRAIAAGTDRGARWSAAWRTIGVAISETVPATFSAPKIQKELPAWIQRTGNKEALSLMQQLEKRLKAKNFDEAEKTADSILKMMSERP